MITYEKEKETLLKEGVTSVKGVVRPDQVALLKQEVDRLLNQEISSFEEWDKYPAKTYLLPLATDGNWTALNNLIGRSPIIDRIIDEVLSQSSVKSLLESVLGKNYRLWQTGIRRSEVKDSGLKLHQDAKGQTNFTILIEDTHLNSGATIYYRGSHLSDIHITHTGFDRLPFKLCKLVAPPVLGKAGDIEIFFTKTWHGRQKNKSGRACTAIQMGFFPEGYPFGTYDVPQNVLAGLGPELSRLLSPPDNSVPAKGDRPIDHVTNSKFKIWSKWTALRPTFFILKNAADFSKKLRALRNAGRQKISPLIAEKKGEERPYRY